ncbi:Alpha/Beta hydrolase protein [Suillus paluster]|uniref:Alpha/Beta hydrolase protein n=1 Tax=Suillus paluster TaxID=48578 RepID=UPI001B86E5FF|nr:Alpha/Beta hydrolase protein [Suillus paluster]KAG1724954.1 Alpha/Beta hydrolase protein [Suillus paluster]
MLSAIFALLNLGASFNNLNDALKQTPIGPMVDSGYVAYPSSQLYQNAVDLGYVTYFGDNQPEMYPNTVAHLGIPYAERPVGDLRFRATVPLNTTRVTEEAGGSPVDATSYPDFCIQGQFAGQPGGAGSEDCLNVNVYSPYGAKEGDNLPVLFYIHGGAWIFGNPRGFPFEHWVNQSPNVIIVSVYYRLGSLGFLAAPEFTDPAYGDFNAGLRDQIQALKWVKSYISKFGGDPTNVTISGHSAGGASVELHMIVDESKGLFSRVIAQSVGRSALPTPKQQQPLFESYASLAGCENGSVADQMKCLRGANISALAFAQDNALHRDFGYVPIVDGLLITGHPTTKFQCGEFTHVPLIVGSASNETLSLSPKLDISTGLKAFFPSLTDTDIQQFLGLYPIDDFDSKIQQFQVATGEPDVICAVSLSLTLLPWATHPHYSNTWTYRYNTPDPTLNTKYVTHAAENWMMFNGTTTGPNGTSTFDPQTDAQKAFASELIAYWLSFVRTGDPNTYKLDKSPVWEKYSESNLVRMVLTQQNSATESGNEMEILPLAEFVRCAFAISKAEACQH